LRHISLAVPAGGFAAVQPDQPGLAVLRKDGDKAVFGVNVVKVGCYGLRPTKAAILRNRRPDIVTSRPLYCTAAGRLLLAHADDDWLEGYLHKTKLERRTPQTIAGRKELRAELEKVLQAGYSVSVGELLRESAGIAAPIVGSDGKVVAALAIGAPSDRFEVARPTLQEMLVDVARRASGIMPGSGLLRN
jgi:hypothetical protein